MKITLIILSLVICLSPVRSVAAPVCWLGAVPCFVACAHPPNLSDAEQASSKLSSAEYEHINRLDQVSAVVTTQFFKCMGINGWKRYGFHVFATGTVEQAATSWDGLRTIDMVLSDFDGSAAYRSLPTPNFIRAEVIRRVWKQLDYEVCPGDQIRIEGELNWDGHGFLEIHPSLGTDIRFLSIPTHSKHCPGSK